LQLFNHKPRASIREAGRISSMGKEEVDYYIEQFPTTTGSFPET
jgi:hypothetical protein